MTAIAPGTAADFDDLNPFVAGDDLTNELLASKERDLERDVHAEGRAAIDHIPTAGLKQALALRDWIVEKYKSGDLSSD